MANQTYILPVSGTIGTPGAPLDISGSPGPLKSFYLQALTDDTSVDLEGASQNAGPWGRIASMRVDVAGQVKAFQPATFVANRLRAVRTAGAGTVVLEAMGNDNQAAGPAGPAGAAGTTRYWSEGYNIAALAGLLAGGSTVKLPILITRPGNVTGIRYDLSAVQLAGEDITIEVELNGAPLGTPVILAVAGDGVVSSGSATFAPVAGNAYVAGDFLALVVTTTAGVWAQLFNGGFELTE